MSGPQGTPNGVDRLAEIEAELPAAWSHLSVVHVRVDDVLALVEIAKQARRCYERGLIEVTPDSEALEHALARLDSGAAEETT